MNLGKHSMLRTSRLESSCLLVQKPPVRSYVGGVKIFEAILTLLTNDQGICVHQPRFRSCVITSCRSIYSTAENGRGQAWTQRKVLLLLISVSAS